ncbi:DUF5004 domain-containing protein [Dinghuibacter silviterrae]|uniref:Uncharacterized protein DUF5004 n=1 Tax=Dinghuibacter silviterrae TaxID=1539049 RepID=A0A4R8DFG0_9BACT|nr:DUF5004 domain-containing protein [Dinghuibacter silviterrae]TDW96321.1 uncharacterized protein DUF5004 [Dinghuibacter silviterrae]
MNKILKAALLVMMAAACKVESNLKAPVEPVKKITGTWQIVDATENGTDLMQWFDFTKFRITFADSTYTLDSLLPFMVSANGKWKVDDPQYPFSITLTPTDSAAVVSPLSFPVVGGVRNMILTFSPGCNKNSYQYTLQPVTQ